MLNQKEQFTKMNASLSAKLETAVTKIEDLEADVAKSKKSLVELNEVLDKVKVELEETRGEKLKVELELQQANVSFEKGRVDSEKANQELLRQRDLELFGVRKSAEEEVRRSEERSDELGTR